MNSLAVNQKRDIWAEIIRVVTIPATLVLVMMIILTTSHQDFFHSGWDIFVIILALVIFPMLAYPLQYAVPKWKKQGRKFQRKLAFITSIIGYVGGTIYVFAAKCGKELKFIMLGYLFSAVILTIFNKLIHIRASGHACGITGPLLFLSYFEGRMWFVICLFVMILSFWASLRLKRHQSWDLFYGVVTCLLGFLLSYCLFMI